MWKFEHSKALVKLSDVVTDKLWFEDIVALIDVPRPSGAMSKKHLKNCTI